MIFHKPNVYIGLHSKNAELLDGIRRFLYLNAILIQYLLFRFLRDSIKRDIK